MEKAAALPRDLPLDGLRGLAVLSVVVYHASFFRAATDLPSRIAYGLPALGWSGVDLFFVLSGFLITRILLERRDSPSYYRTFYGRRVLRILPPYYALLLFCFVGIPAVGRGWNGDMWLQPGGEPLWYWLFLNNLYDALSGSFHHYFLSIAWSLAIEEQFYLVWPFVVARLTRERLEQLCVGVMVGCLGLRIAAVLADVAPLAIYLATPFRLDTLAAGAWVALRTQRDGGFDGLAPRAAWLLATTAAIPLAIAAIVTVDPSWLARPGNRLLVHPVMQTVGFSALAVFFGALLVHVMAARGRSRFGRLCESRPLRGLGRISYVLYLIHVPVLFSITVWVARPADPAHSAVVNQLLRYALGLSFSIGLATLSWFAFERPLLRLRKRIPYEAPRPDPPEA